MEAQVSSGAVLYFFIPACLARFLAGEGPLLGFAHEARRAGIQSLKIWILDYPKGATSLKHTARFMREYFSKQNLEFCSESVRG